MTTINLSPARKRELFDKFLLKKQKRTPKPEIMFLPLIRAGLAYIERRRGQQPILRWVKHKQEKAT